MLPCSIGSGLIPIMPGPGRGEFYATGCLVHLAKRSHICGVAAVTGFPDGAYGTWGFISMDLFLQYSPGWGLIASLFYHHILLLVLYVYSVLLPRASGCDVSLVLGPGLPCPSYLESPLP